MSIGMGEPDRAPEIANKQQHHHSLIRLTREENASLNLPQMGTKERLFPSVEALMRLELTALSEGTSAVGEVADVWFFPGVRAEMGLEALFSGEDAFAVVALDVGGRGGSLGDEGPHHIRPRPPSPLVGIRVRRGDG